MAVARILLNEASAVGASGARRGPNMRPPGYQPNGARAVAQANVSCGLKVECRPCEVGFDSEAFWVSSSSVGSGDGSGKTKKTATAIARECLKLFVEEAKAYKRQIFVEDT